MPTGPTIPWGLSVGAIFAERLYEAFRDTLLAEPAGAFRFEDITGLPVLRAGRPRLGRPPWADACAGQRARHTSPTSNHLVLFVVIGPASGIIYLTNAQHSLC